MGSSAAELVESKHNSEKIIGKKYVPHLFNGISASKVNIKIRFYPIPGHAPARNIHRNADVTGGGWNIVSQWSGTSSIPGQCLCLLISS